jgi:hypothetical protein
MSQELEKVSVERDDGHKSRWAFGKWVYRKEAGKKSINVKRAAIAVGVVVLVTTVILLFRGPTQVVQAKGNPIGLENNLPYSGTNSQSIPAVAQGGDQKTLRSDLKPKAKKFIGVEHIERPRLTSIPPGLVGNAVLLSGATDGRTRAELEEDLLFNGEVLLPKGVTLIGAGSSGEDRLTITFSKVVFSDGKTETISAEALDPSDQILGIKGSKVSKYFASLAAAGALSFAGGAAAGLQESDNQGGVAVRKSDLRNAALNGTATAALDTSKEIVTKWKDKKNVIQVKAGTKIQIAF